MGSLHSTNAHDQARGLVRHYLDPTRSWSPDLDTQMRALLREDDVARTLYDEAVVAHRLAVGADPEQQSGFERERMMSVVLDQAVGQEASEGVLAWLTSAVSMRWLGVAATVAIVVLMVRPWTSTEPGDDLRARGGESAETAQPLVGFGVSGVTADGREYEVVASGELSMDDHIRVTYTNEDPLLGHLFLLGLQADNPLIWYAPLPPDETTSVTIDRGKGALPFEIRVGARHRAGPVKMVALFTAQPVSTQRVERALDSSLANLNPTALATEVARRLGTGGGDRIRVLETRIQAAASGEGQP